MKIELKIELDLKESLTPRQWQVELTALKKAVESIQKMFEIKYPSAKP